MKHTADLFSWQLSDKQTCFASHEECSAYLDSLGLFSMKPGLERMEQTLQALGLERPPYYTVQVVGTNGKGSTSTMLAKLAETHGLSAGLHTSPHFLSPKERIKINGAMLSDAEWTACANKVAAAQKEKLSYFEFLTCLAAIAFARAKVDIAIMESGLGGSFDATTAIDADMLLFTAIALDHQSVLGNSLEQIAEDKAGAIRSTAPLISAVQQPRVRDILARRAEEFAASLTLVDQDASLPLMPDGAPPLLALPGKHQQGNALLALAAWRAISVQPAFSHTDRLPGSGPLERRRLENRALAEAWLPGRMQYCPALPSPQALAAAFAHTTAEETDGKTLHAFAAQPPVPLSSLPVPPAFIPCSWGWPPLLLDGAHNSHGLAALGLALAQAAIGPLAVIFSCLADKEPEQMVPHLRSLATGPIFIPPVADNPRAADPRALARLIGVNAVPAASLREALELASAHMAERLPGVFSGQHPNNPLLLCGSLYLLGEFYALRPDCLLQVRSARKG